MRSVFVLAGYIAAYVALDWVSYIHPLGPFAITPWNPPPGLSLAVLLVYGLRFAPALFVAGLAAELIVRGWPASLAHTLLATAVVAAGYAPPCCAYGCGSIRRSPACAMRCGSRESSRSRRC
jgi:two-component system, LuxR family, sensor kinase FixL